MTAQIEALRKEARLYVSSKSRARGEGGVAGASSGTDEDSVVGDDLLSPEAQLAATKRALDEAKENEVR